MRLRHYLLLALCAVVLIGCVRKQQLEAERIIVDGCKCKCDTQNIEERK